MDKWKKILIILIAILCVAIIIKTFMKKDYKINETGNNKTIKEIENYILNINSYKAKITVTVTSNKNKNNYTMEQEVKENYAKQIVKEPKEIEGMEIIYENGEIQFKNTELDLTKVYTNYPYIAQNNLFLNDFIKQYCNSNKKSITEINGKVMLEYESNYNKYNSKQILYINKENMKPEILQTLDKNNDCKVYILYNEIELNI